MTDMQRTPFDDLLKAVADLVSAWDDLFAQMQEALIQLGMLEPPSMSEVFKDINRRYPHYPQGFPHSRKRYIQTCRKDYVCLPDVPRKRLRPNARSRC